MLSFPCRSMLGLLLYLTAGLCTAQEGTTPLTGPAAMVACLAPTDRGEPAYPSELMALGVDRSVEVELTFHSQSGGPHVRVLTENKFDDGWTRVFFKSVERFVSQYRLPCMEDGPVKLTQTFHFRADRRPVFWQQTREELEYARAGCTRDYVGKPYDFVLGYQWRYGNVVSELTFNQQDTEPQVRVIYTPEQDLLPQVTQRLQGFRLRCQRPLEVPVRINQVLSLTGATAKGVALQPMDLITLVKSVRRETLGNVVFDFNTMSCPFAVRLQLLQPFARNQVGELEQTDPNRRPFLQWLAGLAYRYPAAYETFLVGAATTVTVPCMKLDLS